MENKNYSLMYEMDRNDRLQSIARTIVYVLSGLSILFSLIMMSIAFANNDAVSGWTWLGMVISDALLLVVYMALFAHLDNAGLMRDFMSDVNDRLTQIKQFKQKEELPRIERLIQGLEKLTQEIRAFQPVNDPAANNSPEAKADKDKKEPQLALLMQKLKKMEQEVKVFGERKEENNQYRLPRRKRGAAAHTGASAPLRIKISSHI